MNTLGISDIPAHEALAIRNLTKHLHSEFHTKRYPSASFVITKVDYLKPDSLLLDGNMTIKDVTKNIKIPVVFARSTKGGDYSRTAFKLDRFVWNIGEDGSWLEKRVVDREFGLSLKIGLYKAKPEA